MQIIIAPMAGITDYSFRKILAEFSPDIIFTEMVDINAIINNNKKTFDEILKTENNEAVQIFGNKNENFQEAVKILVKKGFRHIDINLGCPMKKIIKSGKGSALLAEQSYVREIVSNIQKEFKNEIKLSLKIRTGYKEFNDPEYYVKLIKEFRLYQICIHGRTQEQGYQGTADWNIIKELKAQYKEVRIIGNGDLFTIEDIAKKSIYAQSDGIMLARGIFGNPWLIKQAKNFFNTGKINKLDISNEEIKNTLIRHINYYIEDKGEKRAYLDMRKHIFWYLKDFENINKIKKDILKYENIKDTLKYIVNNT